MNPIDTLFQTLKLNRQKAFIPFLPAGDPDLGFTADALATVAGAGASLIEVGFPFSDPIADGPVIQASYTRALNRKLKLAELFAAVKPVLTAPTWQTPTVGMVSYSLIWKQGPAAFLATAKAAGFSGVVVPDLPVEESSDLAKLCADHDFKLILLVTPTTSATRAEQIVKACSGFVYVVSVVGITGEQAKGPTDLGAMIGRLRAQTDLPLCVGFGVSQPKHVRDLRDLVDGVIVGTAFVRKLELATTDRAGALSSVRSLCEELSRALVS